MNESCANIVDLNNMVCHFARASCGITNVQSHFVCIYDALLQDDRNRCTEATRKFDVFCGDKMCRHI